MAKKARTKPDPVKNTMMEHYNRVQGNSGCYNEQGVPEKLGNNTVHGFAGSAGGDPTKHMTRKESHALTKNHGQKASVSKQVSKVHNKSGN